MRSAGFPCRFGGCDVSFPVADQTSMVALLAASEARTAHEIAVHGYRHVRPPEVTWVSPYLRAKPKRED